MNNVLQVPCVWAKLPIACQSKWTWLLLCTYLSLHADIYKKTFSTFIYIYVKTCIFRAMSTGLKMQYPEAVKENGKKKPNPKIHHLFLINLIFLCGKTCMATDCCVWVKQGRSPLPLLQADLDIFCVHGICEQEVQSSPLYPSEPSLQLLPAKVGSCL